LATESLQRDSFVLPEGRRVHAEKGDPSVIRKLALALSLLALPLGMIVASGSAANAAIAHKTPVTFTGSVSCDITGSISASPPLLLDTPKTTTITLKATAATCTGDTTQSGVTLTKGAVSGKVKAKKLDCEALLSGVPSPKGTIKWSGKGGTIAPSDVTLSNGSAAFGASSTTITFTSTQTGSFAGSGSVSGTVNQTETQLIDECDGAGIKKLTIASGTLSLNPATS
jgi:hypothetical protein